MCEISGQGTVKQSHQHLLFSFTTTTHHKSTKIKSFIVVALLVAVAAAIPVDPSSTAVIQKYESDNIGVEGYNYAFQQSDGISAAESGQLRNIGTENEALVVRGQFSYVGPDGVTYEVTYTADENGFKPQGAHIPQ